MQTITLTGGAIAPLRIGTYDCLATAAEALLSACTITGREDTTAARDAYLTVIRVGRLLCRAGWDRAALSVEIEEQPLAQTAREALEAARDAFADRALDARERGDDEDAQQQAALCAEVLALLETADSSLHDDGPVVGTYSFDEQQADVIREALRELLIDRASHLESALSDPRPDAPERLRATMDAGAAVQAASWEGPLRLGLDAHLPVLREALRRLAVDMRGMDAQTPVTQRSLAICEDLLREIEAPCKDDAR